MRALRTALAATALSLTVSAQLEKNRLQLDNGGDIFWFISPISVGSDPANGDYDGDMYYKVIPESANQHCSGEWTWTGSEFQIYDSDWSTPSDVYTLVLTPAVDPEGDSVLEPVFGAASEIILPGFEITWEDLTGVPYNPATDCPPPGLLGGFLYREFYIDAAAPTQTFDPAFQGLAQGDYAVANFYPDGRDINLPAINSCGDAGDFSWSWNGSTNFFDPSEGENQPDWTGISNASAYGGFQVGGTGGTLILDGLDAGSDFGLLIDGPTLNIKVDVGLEPAPFIETGLAGLNPQIGVDLLSGLPNGSTARVGAQISSESSKPTLNANGIGSGGLPYVGLIFINVGPTLIDTGSCIDIPGVLSNLAMNPGDPALTVLTAPSGINLFTDGDPSGTAGPENANIDWDGNGSFDDGVYNGNMIPINPSPGLVGIAIQWQGFTANAVTSVASGTNVVQSVLRGT